jgi:hypothetical protein
MDGQSAFLRGDGGASLLSGGAPGQFLSPGGFGGGGAGYFDGAGFPEQEGGGGGGYNGGDEASFCLRREDSCPLKAARHM